MIEAVITVSRVMNRYYTSRCVLYTEVETADRQKQSYNNFAGGANDKGSNSAKRTLTPHEKQNQVAT